MSDELKAPWRIVHMVDGTARIQNADGGEVLTIYDEDVPEVFRHIVACVNFLVTMKTSDMEGINIGDCVGDYIQKNTRLSAQVAELREALENVMDAFWDMSPLEYAASRKLSYMSDDEGERILQAARAALANTAPASGEESPIKKMPDGVPCPHCGFKVTTIISPRFEIDFGDEGEVGDGHE